MRTAIIGSRNLIVDISKYVPDGITEIVSGGARGIDALIEKYADERNIPKLIIKPDYDQYGQAAPLERNKIIVDISDIIIAVWDGKSRGTKYVIDYAKKTGKHVEVYFISRV